MQRHSKNINEIPIKNTELLHFPLLSEWQVLYVTGCNQWLKQDRPVCADTPHRWRSFWESERAAGVDVVDMLTVRVGQFDFDYLYNSSALPSITDYISILYSQLSSERINQFKSHIWHCLFTFVGLSLTGRVTMPRRHIYTRCKI